MSICVECNYIDGEHAPSCNSGRLERLQAARRGSARKERGGHVIDPDAPPTVPPPGARRPVMREVPAPGLHAIASASFEIFGVEVKCHVLNNGQRVIDADSVAQLFSDVPDGQAKLRQHLIDADPKDVVSHMMKWLREGE